MAAVSCTMPHSSKSRLPQFPFYRPLRMPCLSTTFFQLFRQETSELSLTHTYIFIPSANPVSPVFKSYPESTHLLQVPQPGQWFQPPYSLPWIPAITSIQSPDPYLCSFLRHSFSFREFCLIVGVRER